MMEREANGVILNRFVANCRALRIDTEIKQNAIKTFHSLNVDGVLSNDADDWLCCAVYSELQKNKMKDMRQDEEHSKTKDLESWDKKARFHSWNISVTEVLRIFKINIKKFLKRMEHWNWMAQNPDVFQQEICDLDRRLGITLLLAHHYKRIFNQLYVLPVSKESQSHYHMIYEFGWLLFLVIRNELPNFATTNIINGCQVLICAIELVFLNALEVHKSHIINTDFKGVPPKWCTSHFDTNRLDKYSAIEAICQLIPELPEKGVCIMKSSFFHEAVMGLFMDQRLLGNDRVKRELIKDGILEVNLTSLNRCYAIHVSDISEMDERVLLKYDAQSPTNKARDTKLSNGKEDTAFAFADQLVDDTQRDNLRQLVWQELPKSLPVYISNVLGKSDSSLLQNSLRDMCLKFEVAANLNQDAAECRFKLVSGLYYMLLDKITEAELRRRPTIKLGQMLMQLQSTFNATLIACCLQLVLHIFETQETSLQFPWLLDCFDIDAFEFQKILELVVRHESGLLTRDLIKHLREVEAQCITSLIWRKNSQLWRIYAGAGLPTYQSVQSSSGQENSKVTQGSIVICLRKFYHLANQRLSYLCKGLSLLARYTQIWHIVEHSIVVLGTELLQQRHLDQLLMCAVYLCARTARLRISFSDIIQQYRRQPLARSDIYRAVHLTDGQAATDIISFYNQVYVKRMADYARELQCEQFSDSNSDSIPTSSVIRPLQNISNKMCLKSNGHKTNVFVSPEAMPPICMYNRCKAKIITQLATPVNLKRAHSTNELGEPTSTKRPNILSRRTTFQ
ncbi:retinoblastoma family protein [Drosophila innubila]|uniref:retinoblastoma family protein n=1 Tax=Drosophila innubila TaxID=198719 RepID=UPI00148DFA63|nr:retinoblastoma family protein [Drosophila innubila]